MFPLGHYGMALLVYSAVGCALLVRGRRRDALGGGAVVLLFTIHPDLDSQFPALAHRGVTHTLWFALLVGGVCVAVVATRLRRSPTRSAVAGGLWAFSLGALSILAHMAADALTPWGVVPLSPVASTSYTANVTLASNPTANRWLLGAGMLAAGVAWWLGNSIRRGSYRPRTTAIKRLYWYLRGTEDAGSDV